MRLIWRLVKLVALMLLVLIALYIGTSPPPAKADVGGCSAGRAPFSAWSNCDYGWNDDGSHMHCDAVFVFGFGGRNCYFVPPVPAPL